MSIVEAYVPFTRMPPPGKRNRPGRVEGFLSETEELLLSPSRQLLRGCRASALQGILGFVMTSEHGSVMLTFDPEDGTVSGRSAQKDRSAGSKEVLGH